MEREESRSLMDLVEFGDHIFLYLYVGVCVFPPGKRCVICKRELKKAHNRYLGLRWSDEDKIMILGFCEKDKVYIDERRKNFLVNVIKSDRTTSHVGLFVPLFKAHIEATEGFKIEFIEN